MFGIDDFTQKIVDFSNFEASQLTDALFFGGAILLIGMLAVFAVLTLLWFCLVLFRIAFQSSSENSGATENTKVSPTDVPTAEAVRNDGEIVAVIAAAIAMAESESSGAKFKVVSFRRK